MSPTPDRYEYGYGVASRSGRAGTPRGRGPKQAWLRRLLGFDQPPLAGVAEVDPADVDHETGRVWSGYLNRPPEQDEKDRTGICCSGGGIRAASFALGGLEALQEAHVLQDADYLASVSGGGYQAIGYAALQGLTWAKAPSHAEARELLDTPAPWSLGAPETVNLRNHTHYLAPNLSGAVWGVAVILYGLVRHLLPFVAATLVGGVLFGWALHDWHFLDFGAPGSKPRVGHDSVLLAGEVCAIIMGVAAALVCVRLGEERVGVDGTGYGTLAILAMAVVAGVGAGTAMALSGIHFPGVGAGSATGLVCAALTVAATLFALLAWLGLGAITDGALAHVILEAWTVRLALLATAGAALFCGMPFVMSLIPLAVPPLLGIFGAQTLSVAGLQKAARYARSLVPSDGTKKTGPASFDWRKAAVTVASYVIGPAVVATALLLLAYVSANRGLRWDGFNTGPWLLLAAVYLAGTWLFDDEIHSPLHTLYRERLSTAFIRYRVKATGVGRVSTEEPPWDEHVHLSALKRPEGMPKLVICAAVNVSDDVVPPGRYAGSFTFEHDWSGGPLTGYVRTVELEKAAGRGVLTLPGMMAISGAAVSPLMGRDTRPGLRLLLALFDVRLGMWLPNPRKLGARPAGTTKKNPPDRHFPVPAGSPFCKDGTSIGPPTSWRRAGWSYSLAEALGTNSLRKSYVYVTDGGHWENLGLVELMRRGCTRIVCLDASNDSHTLSTLGQAMSLARDELCIDFDIDTDKIAPGSAGDKAEPRLSKAAAVRGTFTYPNGRTGTLVVAKAVLSKDSPRDVMAFAATDAHFPQDTTVNQYYDDLHFDGYRELGHHAGKRAIALLP